MKKVSIFLLLLFFTACTTTTYKKLAHNNRLLIAVGNINNETGNKLYDIVSESDFSSPFIHELHATGCFRIIERSQLELILKEHQLSVTGLANPTETKKIGKILGVDAILYISLSSVEYKTFENIAGRAKNATEELEVLIGSRLIDVNTGEILASAQYQDEESNAYSSVGSNVSTGKPMNKIDVIRKIITEDAPSDIADQLAEQVYKIQTTK